MNDTVKKILSIISIIILFIVSMACVIIGQQYTGPIGLIVMLLGLGGLLVLLWLYNRQYK